MNYLMEGHKIKIIEKVLNKSKANKITKTSSMEDVD